MRTSGGGWQGLYVGDGNAGGEDLVACGDEESCDRGRKAYGELRDRHLFRSCERRWLVGAVEVA